MQSKPTKPACVHVAASGVRAARSWWGTTNRSHREHLKLLRAGGVVWTGRSSKHTHDPYCTRDHYVIDSCLRNREKGYGHEDLLNQIINVAGWGVVE